MTAITVRDIETTKLIEVQFDYLSAAQLGSGSDVKHETGSGWGK